MFYPLLQFSFFSSFCFREVSVNDDIVVKLIVFFFSEVPSWRNRLPGYVQHLFVGPVLKPKETHFPYALLLAYYWLGGDFYLFIFIGEVRIRHWSRNLSQKFYRDVLMKRNPNRCIVAFWWSEIQIDVSSHFDEAKSKSIVAFWWSEIQIDRRIVIERNTNRCIVAFWWRLSSGKSKFISDEPGHCDFGSAWWRNWLCSIFPGYNRQRILLDPVSKPKVASMSRTEDELSLAIRVKMSISNLAN